MSRPTHPLPLIGAFPLALALLGCGPSSQQLLAGNHFREATCAIAEGEVDAQEVSLAFTRALDPQLHVEVMSDETVAAAAPQAPAEVRGRVLFVRVRVVTNEVPIDHLAVSLEAVGQVPAHPMELDALAKLTGERAPASHTSTETHYIENAVSGAISIFTLGLIDPAQRGPTTHVVPPLPLEWKLTAPNAYDLYTAFSGPGCEEHRRGPDDAQHVSMTCAATFMVERVGTGSLALDMGVDYQAARLSRNQEMRSAADDASWTCRLKTRLHVPLGPVGDLSKATLATFGPRFRAVKELDAAAGHDVAQ